MEPTTAQFGALNFLIEKYLEWQGKNAFEICRKNNIKVAAILNEPINGKFVPSNSPSILLPLKPLSLTFEQLIAFHELGHYFIDEALGDVFRKIHHDYHEAWCDNFSLLMLFALYDYKLLGIDDYKKFFRDGENLDRPQESDPFLGKKILLYLINPNQLNLPFEEKPIVNALHPLVDLAHLLIKQK